MSTKLGRHVIVDKEKVEKKFDKDETKFNFDLAYQEILCNIIKYISEVHINKNLSLRFSGLKLLSLKLINDKSVSDNIIKNNERLKDDCCNKLNKFKKVCTMEKINYSPYDKDYKSSVRKPRQPSLNFRNTKRELEENLDEWDIFLTSIMIDMGLYLTKKKTGVEAAGS